MSHASCLLALALLACSPRPHPEAPDAILLIVIDTLRADHLGCYGHAAPTSPHLDRLAAAGTRFTRATTHVPVTQPSVSSVLTGRLPLAHGVRDNHGFVLAADEQTLAERLRAAGYRTAAVVGSSVLARDRGLDQGFESYDSDFDGEYPVYDRSLDVVAEQLAGTRRRADRVTELALERVRAFGDQPWFLLVHYFDPHSHYDPPPQHRELFTHPYDGEIHFVDAQIGRLLAGIGVDRRSLVAVVADHGESFGEHGEVGHGFLLHESTLHVPLILSGHGVPRGATRTELVGLIDVEPTLAALSRVGASDSPRDGRDLFAPTLVPADQYAETMRTLLQYNWAPLRALRRDDIKWIEGPAPEAYDLAADPRELNPLAADDPRALAVASALHALIGDDDPLAIRRSMHEPDPQRAEQLAALGYVGLEEETPLSEALADPKSMLPIWNRRQHNRARYREALALLQLGRLEAAIAKLDTVLLEQPGKVEALHNRGTARMQLGQAEAARADLRAAIDRDPDYVPALRALAQDRLQREEFARALPLLEALVQLEPDQPEHHYNLGACADRLGKAELAQSALRRFLELAGPDDARRAVVQQWLGSSEGSGG